MKIVWLGQAGLLLYSDNKKILIDPYLSNSVEKINPQNYRRLPINEDFFKIRPDVLVLTHNHLDHTDPETLKKYLDAYSDITVLASKNAWETVRKFGGNHNYVMFNAGTQWSYGNVKFTAVKAEHSDDYAIGVVVDDGNKKIYITGDTLYNKDIFNDIPKGVDILFLPVNGAGNNMNMTDAVIFAKKVNAKKVVPVHYGMFDEISPADFCCENKLVLTPYEETEI